MPCTTILVGKDASYDGSTIIARNEDSSNGEFTEKEFKVVQPEDQPRHYTSVISHVEIDLPDNPMRYTSVPDALLKNGLWAEHGVNTLNVAMSATETLTSNERVLGADPLVELIPASADGQTPEVPGGIGEEDMLTIVLPYITSARDGVRRLGALLEEYGTYEMNGIAFSDVDEIWWLETIGGHHWIAKRVPDDSYVVMPNQLGIDEFDLEDAFGEQEEHMCSADLREFIEENHLDLAVENVSAFNPRLAFGSHSDSDHVYNTPRAWWIQRFFNPYDEDWDSVNALHSPVSDDIPWARQPERKITIEDMKYALSGHYQGTPYDPYGKDGSAATRGQFRAIGINRNCDLCAIQIRPYASEASRSIQWTAFGSNPFNTFVPFFTNVDAVPAYLTGTTETVDTAHNFYWANRVIGALADARYNDNRAHIDRYVLKTGAAGVAAVKDADAKIAAFAATEGDAAVATTEDKRARTILEAANAAVCDLVQKETNDVLSKVLYTTSMSMTNAFSMSDN
ncbi:dipeptidase [Alloscardovia macacae]|uniref:Dipeptidase n=1 Tax=Alloscardovia macacae TaxID=1160091 RepID=A0A1Y2SU92_9BIFI|nr:C69 family dipeptidase [Alloscardovia macacae]OTA26510.1 dipeptidase [Alloscardovia macacae]OTA29811.1 dipeptidase [Alloscardovia macacae]